MRKIVILAVSIMVIALMLAFASTALAAAPHGGYGTGNAPSGERTDLCLSCHDVHNAAGDYVLMREATVTAVCGTCHVVFGAGVDWPDFQGDISVPSTPDGQSGPGQTATPTWTEPPCPGTADNAGADGYSSGCSATLNNANLYPEASVSPTSAYETLTPVSGHRLGTGSTKSDPDYIPASTSSLRVIKSADYEEGEIYDHNPASSLSATAGLYCASCHTPHGAVTGRDLDADGHSDIPEPTGYYNTSGVLTSEWFTGDQLVADDTGAAHPHRAYANWLLSSNPNHLSAREQIGEADGDGDGIYCEATDGWTAANDTIIPNGLCDKGMAPTNPVEARDEFCVRCHDKQWSAESVFTDKGLVPMSEGVGADEGHSLSPNHPPLCMSCHGPAGSGAAPATSSADFPHTSMNYKILSKDHDGLCLGCHSSGRLP